MSSAALVRGAARTFCSSEGASLEPGRGCASQSGTHLATLGQRGLDSVPRFSLILEIRNVQPIPIRQSSYAASYVPATPPMRRLSKSPM
jgi:hypothetical protein